MMRILVVDDSAMMRKIIRKELEQGGYEIFEAVDGVDSLEKLDDVQPHLITMDVDMPRMNGFEAAFKIRSSLKPLTTEVERKVPIIFVTANDSLEGRTKGFESGAADFITKPFAQGDILRAVNKQLKPDTIFRGLTALIAEDSTITQHILEMVLQSEGINTIIANNGEEAFQIMKARKDEIDLILTDYMMPVMNGDEFCSKVRNELGVKSTPIIFLSGMSERGSILEIFRSGASDYVIKPFAKEELMARVKVHLESEIFNKQLQNQVRDLKRLNELQRDFLAVTSHDLRSPLNGIMGFTNLVLEEAELTELHKGYLRHVTDSGDFLLDLINDILDLSRVQSEQEELQLEILSIKDALLSSTQTVRHMASPKRIVIETLNKCGENVRIRADQSALIRIFNNILSNAIKFTPEGGSVTQVIETTDDNRVCISIIDNGIGIPASKIPELFDKFSKTSRSGTSGEKGTGLGLSITKELVEKHGGTISVTSEEGQGTCFRLLFPLVSSSEVAREQPRETVVDNTPRVTTFEKRRKSVEEIRILIVDDNFLNIKLAKTVLSNRGFQVSVVKNGLEGVDRFVASKRSEDPSQKLDMIFMDLQMPVMNGFNATKRIREYEVQTGVQPIPIIAMTAGAGSEDQTRCMDVGMNGFLQKPLRGNQLEEMIQQFFILE